MADAVGDEVGRFDTWMRSKTRDPDTAFELDPGTRQEYRRRLYNLLSTHDPAEIEPEELDGRKWSAFVTYQAFLEDDYLEELDAEQTGHDEGPEQHANPDQNSGGLLQQVRSWLTTDGPGITDYPEADISAHRSTGKTLQRLGILFFFLSGVALTTSESIAAAAVAAALMYAAGTSSRVQALRWQVELLEDSNKSPEEDTNG
jgi:hypothetical protein